MKRPAIPSDVFRALADPTRRAILERLREGERSAGDLARPFRMSQPAISQHLQILRRVGLVRGRQVGRQRLYRLDPSPLDAVSEWAQRCRPVRDPAGHAWAVGTAGSSSRSAATAPSRERLPTTRAARARGKMFVLRTPLAEMPTITHARTVGVPVRDQEKAREFYTETLGFEVRRDEPMGPHTRWVELAPNGGQTAIVPYTPSGAEPRIGHFTGIVFGCMDAEATYRELSARGVEFTERPTKQPGGGKMAQFRDPDGNTFVLVQE